MKARAIALPLILALGLVLPAASCAKATPARAHSSPAAEIHDHHDEEVPPALDYLDLGTVDCRTADARPARVAVGVEWGYAAGDAAAKAALQSRAEAVRGVLKGFFSTKSASWLRGINQDKIKDDLREQANRALGQSIVQDLRFAEFSVVD